jgi:predicted DNA-binding transcriptional regulator AlpA
MTTPESSSISPASVELGGIAVHRVLDEKTAAELLGISPVTLERMRRSGRAPRHVQLSVRRLGYRVCDLTDWLEARATFGGKVA